MEDLQLNGNHIIHRADGTGRTVYKHAIQRFGVLVVNLILKNGY